MGNMIRLFEPKQQVHVGDYSYSSRLSAEAEVGSSSSVKSDKPQSSVVSSEPINIELKNDGMFIPKKRKQSKKSPKRKKRSKKYH